MLINKINLNNFKSILSKSMFFIHANIKIEINNRKTPEKP